MPEELERTLLFLTVVSTQAYISDVRVAIQACDEFPNAILRHGGGATALDLIDSKCSLSSRIYCCLHFTTISRFGEVGVGRGSTVLEERFAAIPQGSNIFLIPSVRCHMRDKALEGFPR